MSASFDQTVTLKPFDKATAPPLAIHCRIRRIGQTERIGKSRLVLEFEIAGSPDPENLSRVALPKRSTIPARRDNLWEHTCFEAFIGGLVEDGVTPAKDYREFNFSPSGDWNAYHFDDYRSGMRPEPAFSRFETRIETSPRHVRFCVEIPLSAFVPSKTLEIGISAVIEAQDGSKTYWALAHKGERPDFHRRDAFLVRISEQG